MIIASNTITQQSDTRGATMIKFDILNRWTSEVQWAEIKRILDYDADTGIFTYRERVARRIQVGDAAGSVNSEGYRHIRIFGRNCKAHRLAWFYMHGEWPAGIIDHINGQRDDNRIANLRAATRSQNLANSKPNRGDKAAPKGVRFIARNGKWSARIQKDGHSTFLGYFKTQEEAAEAYARAAQEKFGSFARAA